MPKFFIVIVSFISPGNIYVDTIVIFYYEISL